MTDKITVEPLPVDPLAEKSVSAAKTVEADPELDLKFILGEMEGVLLTVFGPYMREEQPMSSLVAGAVRALLELKGPRGHKLVFTRYDLFQIFGLMNKKLLGEHQL